MRSQQSAPCTVLQLARVTGGWRRSESGNAPFAISHVRKKVCLCEQGARVGTSVIVLRAKALSKPVPVKRQASGPARHVRL